MFASPKKSTAQKVCPGAPRKTDRVLTKLCSPSDTVASIRKELKSIKNEISRLVRCRMPFGQFDGIIGDLYDELNCQQRKLIEIEDDFDYDEDQCDPSYYEY